MSYGLDIPGALIFYPTVQKLGNSAAIISMRFEDGI